MRKRDGGVRESELLRAYSLLPSLFLAAEIERNRHRRKARTGRDRRSPSSNRRKASFFFRSGTHQRGSPEQRAAAPLLRVAPVAHLTRDPVPSRLFKRVRRAYVCARACERAYLCYGVRCRVEPACVCVPRVRAYVRERARRCARGRDFDSHYSPAIRIEFLEIPRTYVALD